jgi:precorrin-6A synthase
VRKVFVIGIGAGDPDYLTVQAVRALGRLDAAFVLDKGAAKDDLVQLRREILRRHAPPECRLIEVADPERDRTSPEYGSAVEDWRRRRADICERLIAEELADGEYGAFLVWGDPTLYDSTLGIVEDILGRGDVAFDYEVVPGISSVSALAARHRVSLNRVGRPVQITTGRRLATGFPRDADDVVVMLDAHCAFADLVDEDLDIYWGAYVGTPDELLIAGRLRDVADRIQSTRAQARERKGWAMDTYLLRRSPPAAPPPGGEAP